MTMHEYSMTLTTGPFMLPESQTRLYAPALLPVNPALSKWKKAIGRLYAMMSLTDNWDGEGSPAPDVGIVVSAIELAYALRGLDYPAPTRVMATPSGTVGFEWQQSGVYTETEIVTSYRSEWMRIRDGEPPEHWVISGRPFVDYSIAEKTTLTGTVRPEWRESPAYEDAKICSEYVFNLAEPSENASEAFWPSTATPM
jgi:hypothetical protein